MSFGSTYTWKIVYSLKEMNGCAKGVAFVEADTKQWAIHTFQQQYAGQYFTIETCEKIG